MIVYIDSETLQMNTPQIKTTTFSGKRKPSLRTIEREVAYLALTHSRFNIQWGENMLEFEFFGAELHGYGWIRDISGDDIAKKYNEPIRIKL